MDKMISIITPGKICKYPKSVYFFCYTILWGVIMAVWLSCFFSNGKTTIWIPDGLPQHWTALAYYGQWLREIVHDLFINHTLSIPLWDINIGPGSDVITTLSYYALGDPLNLLAVFFSTDNTEWLFTILIAVRCYLSGAGFSLYCLYHKNGRAASLAGSLIYAFCGFSIIVSMRHPFFANPMVYLPFLLLGIDKIFDRKKPTLFIIMTAVSAMSNFYFFYMLCIFMFIYAVFRYFMTVPSWSVKSVGNWFFRFLFYYAVGLCIAAVQFLPVLMSITKTARFSVKHYVPILYDKAYYLGLIECFNQDNSVSPRWTILGFTCFGVAGIITLFAKKKSRKDKFLIGGFLLLIFLSVPYAAHVINGFAYVSNRWSWAMAMLAAYIFVVMYPAMVEICGKEKIIFTICAGLYIYFSYKYSVDAEGHAAAFALFAALIIILNNITGKRQWIFTTLVYGGLILQLCMIITAKYGADPSALVKYPPVSQTYVTAQNGQNENLLIQLPDDTAWRYDEENPQGISNGSMLYGLKGTQFYFSTANPVVGNLFNDMWKNDPLEMRYENLDERSILETLFSVKYFAAEKDKLQYVPSLYNEAVLEDDNTVIYRNPNALSLGYTYDSYIPLDQYNNLTVVEKQYAMLQGAVTDESNLPEYIPQFDDITVDYKITSHKKIDISPGKWTVGKRRAKVILELPDEIPDGELYLQFEGLHYNGEDVKAKINVSFEDIHKRIDIRNNRNTNYSGRHNFLCNLGERRMDSRQIKLVISRTGEYTFDNLSIVVQPTDRILTYAKQLGEEQLENVVVDDNYITGDIYVNQPKLLCMTVPYSEGWELYVDGKEQEIKKVNTAFIGTELEKGAHKIQLVYRTPWIKLGLLLSVLGVIALIIISRKRQGY